MPEWLAYLIAVPAGLAGGFAVLAALVFGFAALTRLFRRRMDHPTLGPIERAWGDGWRGARPCGSAFAGPSPVRFRVVAGRNGPDPAGVAMHDRLEGRWHSVDPVLLDGLVREIRALGPDIVGAAADEAARTGDRAALLGLSSLEEIVTEIDEDSRDCLLEIRLLHAWDAERYYVLRLDAQARPLAYGLGVGDLRPLEPVPV